MEDVSLAAGSWNIVSASLQVRDVSAKYILADTTYDYEFNPKVKLIPVSSTRLNWTRNLNQENPYVSHSYPLSINFVGGDVCLLYECDSDGKVSARVHET